MPRLGALLGMLGAAGVVLGLGYWASRGLADPALPAVAPSATRVRPQGDTLIGAFAEPRDLNPFTTSDATVRRWVLRFTHDTLRDLDPQTGAVRPALAESIVLEPDGALRIVLRRDARFADGTPLTAADVAFSHRCAVRDGLPGGAMRAAATLLAELQPLGPHELRGRGLASHWAAIDQFACGLFVLSRAHVLARLAKLAAPQALPEESSAEFEKLLVRLDDPGPGSAPYMLARGADGSMRWARGQHLDLVRNPFSWRIAAMPAAWNLDGMRLRFVSDAATRLSLLRRGEIDWLADGDLRALHADPELAARLRLAVYDYVALGHYMVVWNCRRGALAQPRVRTALGRLFDREAIAARLLHGDAVPATAWFKPGMPEYPQDLQPPAHDVVAARGELAEVAPLRVQIVGAAEEPLHRRILELAQPSFAAAGVELVAELLESGAYRQRLAKRDFDGLLAVKYHNDPFLDPWPHFHGSQAGETGSNWMGIADAELDRLLDAARIERDAARRAELYRAFARRAHELQPVALLVHPRAVVLLHQRFRDAEVGALGLVPERWWVPAEARLR